MLAEDLVQETFLASIQKIAQLKNPEKAKAWLIRILQNKITDHYRSFDKELNQNQKEVEISAIEQVQGLFKENGRWRYTYTDRTGEAEFLNRPDFSELLAECLELLPEKWREALLAKFIVEKKGKEICQELNISPSLYWQAIHRAKLAMKSCLDTKMKKELL